MLQGPGQFREALQKLLHTQGACAQQLFGTLESEREALAAGDAEQLDLLTRKKSDLLHQLESLGREQQSLLDSLALEDSDAGMDTALAWCDPSDEIRQSRKDLLGHLERCRTLNERNGLTVQYRMGYVRRALDVLNGDPAGTSNVYGRDGRTTSNVHSRLLASG